MDDKAAFGVKIRRRSKQYLEKKEKDLFLVHKIL